MKLATKPVEKSPTTPTKAHGPTGGDQRIVTDQIHTLQQNADMSAPVQRLSSLQRQATGAVMQRCEDDQPSFSGPFQVPFNPSLSPFSQLYQDNPEAAQATFRRLFPFVADLAATPPRRLPSPLFTDWITTAALSNPGTFPVFFNHLYPSPAVLQSALPQTAANLVLTGTPTSDSSTAPPAPPTPTLISQTAELLGTAASGVYEFITEDLLGGVNRTGRRLGMSGEEKRDTVIDEHRRLFALGRRLLHDPTAVIQEVLDVTDECFRQRQERQRLETLATASVKDYVIKAGAATLAGRALVKLPIKHGVTKPYVIPMLERQLASEALGLAPILRQQMQATLKSRVGKFLVSKAVTGVVALPITSMITAITTMGLVERATISSAKLKSIDPQLWQRLHDKNLDFMVVFIDDYIDRLIEENIPLRPTIDGAGTPDLTDPDQDKI